MAVFSDLNTAPLSKHPFLFRKFVFYITNVFLVLLYIKYGINWSKFCRGLKDLRTASDILPGKNTDLQCNIPVQLVSTLKYAPVTSVDVERSFSAYNFVLSDRWHCFLAENLEKVLIIYCEVNYGH
ncbi:hypothetical protein ANN_18442 [Periplaneta americana]|uniref:HAT C-terminal dimerisation domain-containing protein n=1 Tax=Periplaneta americana TaxID=6978 RepID=A0ABQ8SNR9_PERAM|nr:hypothetical protein ANN_18442 [Periplaneta americana]